MVVPEAILYFFARRIASYKRSNFTLLFINLGLTPWIGMVAGNITSEEINTTAHFAMHFTIGYFFSDGCRQDLN